MTTAPAPRPTPVLVIILLSYLMIVLGISIVITALPKMHQALGFSATGLSCVQNAYTLAFGGLLLLSARAGDILGRRRMFVAGLALFTAASLAIGLAPSAAWLLTASAVQGIGAATLAPSTLALLTASFPEGRERTRAVAYYGAVAGGSGPDWAWRTASRPRSPPARECSPSPSSSSSRSSLDPARPLPGSPTAPHCTHMRASSAGHHPETP
jgi:hypothetical protein